MTKEELFAVAVPQKTASYSPVSHQILHEAVAEKILKRGWTIDNERIDTNQKGTQMFTTLGIGVGHGEQRMSVGYRNSYDKSLSVGLVSGSQIIVCSNLMFVGDVKLLRKHTSGVFNDLYYLIDEVLGETEKTFEIALEETQIFKDIPMEKRIMAEVAGRMFIQDEIINSTQLNILKKEINGSENFQEETLWDFYNHTTEALKLAHPSQAMQTYTNFHAYAKELVLR